MKLKNNIKNKIFVDLKDEKICQPLNKQLYWSLYMRLDQLLDLPLIKQLYWDLNYELQLQFKYIIYHESKT